MRTFSRSSSSHVDLSLDSMPLEAPQVAEAQAVLAMHVEMAPVS
jgi:hypothetical protein